MAAADDANQARLAAAAKKKADAAAATAATTAADTQAAEDKYYTKVLASGKTQFQIDTLRNAYDTTNLINTTSPTNVATIDRTTGKVTTKVDPNKGKSNTLLNPPPPPPAPTPETTYTAPDGRIFTDLTAYNSYLQKTKDEEKRRAGQSAYDILFNEFDANGLGDLVQEVKQYIIDGLSPAEFTIKLRASKPYKMRFAANDLRIANGFAAIDESTYLKLEDSYQSIMMNYGLPATYYEKGALGVQKGFQDLIAGNVDPITLEDRIIEGQKITKGNKTVIDAAKRFFPSLTDGDFLAYVLNPKNGLDEIKRKVTAAEIGGAQIGAGLDATLAGAQELATAGVTGKQYQQAAPTIAEAALRGGQLSSFYKQDPYTQQTAEQAILDVPGSAEALKKTKKLTALESASFSGRSGAGAISRDRAGVL